MAIDRKICVGQFAGAHGVRGLAKLRSFTAEPETVCSFTSLSSEDGTRGYRLSFKSAAKDHLIVEVEGITNKEDADLLRGDRLYVAREMLPKTGKGEYYEAELIGLSCGDGQDKDYGKILAVHDHGAGVFLEIGSSKKDSFMLPFKDAFVPEVDLKSGRVRLNVPEDWVGAEKEAGKKPRKLR